MADDASPMMVQYQAIKAGHPGAILFFRMGDFYEMFFDDAVQAAAALDIALTARGVHQGAPIPMCGVPVHSSEGYLLTLIRKGFRVAIAEQIEDPAEARKRGGKSVVGRAVVRLVTPGTLTEDTLLEPRRANWLAAWAEVRGDGALAWGDMSTGELRVAACDRASMATELARLMPREMLVVEGEAREVAALVTGAGASVTALDRGAFDSGAGERRLAELFGVGTVEGYGAFGRAELAALGAIVAYIGITQQGRLPVLRPPVRELPGTTMAIDAATRRSLEIVQGPGGARDGSLLACVDRTVTAAGARLLERRLSAPSRDLDLIAARHGAVGALVADAALRGRLRAALRGVPDLDRALSRLALERGGPRDLAAVRNAVAGGWVVAAAVQGLPPVLAEAGVALKGFAALHDLLDRALVPEPGALVRDGGFIAAGHDAALDAARKLRDEGRGVIAGMQAEYAAETGISGLKIKHNNVLGYFIETTATHAERMMSPPLSARFIHRQTTAGQVRFTTPDLSLIETRILNAGAEALAIEARHFAGLAAAVLAEAAALGVAAAALAEVDLACGWAEIAAEEDWARPVVDDGRAFEVTAGRHPVVERALRRAGGTGFVANDCHLTDGATPAIWLLTGPNMAGKSTFLRQNALIALLAQAGGFVPAQAARIGVVSQLFSRVGASDDLTRGRSTFMVEMVETAAILNQADDRALVILDEIGRGTATWDGLSIAWAVLEHLQAVNRCRALFATHYHEMAALAGRLAGVANAHVTVREWEGEVIFLHEVRNGAADRSYGVQVARLAGLPGAVIARAKAVLEALEAGDRQGGSGAGRAAAMIDDLPLFRAAPVPAVAAPARSSAVEAQLRTLHPDAMTPREALEALYALKGLIGG